MSEKVSGSVGSDIEPAREVCLACESGEGSPHSKGFAFSWGLAWGNRTENGSELFYILVVTVLRCLLCTYRLGRLFFRELGTVTHLIP